MDVSVKTTGSLKRQLKFTVPSAEVEEQVAARLRKMTRTVRLAGFRPGKVPIKVIEERFGESVFHEVASEVVESSYQQAVVEHGLTPAGQPDLKDTNILRGRDIQFTADIELYPEFTPASLEKTKIEKSVAEVCDSDVDAMVERLRLRHAEWRSALRSARDGDRVRVHFEERVEAFNTDENDDLTLTIGAPGVAGDFAGQLLKTICGDIKKIKIKFPKDYPQAKWAGKKMKFKVEVREIEESVLPPLDQDFFEKCDIKEGGLPALKEMLKEGMEYELKNKLESDFRGKVLDALLKKNKFEMPQVMIQREIERMRNEAIERFDVKENADQFGDELFREQAMRRVKLGLIMNKIAEHNKFEVSDREFEGRLDRMVAAYEDADGAKRYYRSDQRARAALTAAVLEDKVFQWLLSQVRVEEKTCNFKEVISPQGA